MLLDAQILAANAFLAGEIILLPYPSPKLAYLRRGTESWRVRFRANIGSERRAVKVARLTRTGIRRN
jgi:hypothetical protein